MTTLAYAYSTINSITLNEIGVTDSWREDVPGVPFNAGESSPVELNTTLVDKIGASFDAVGPGLRVNDAGSYVFTTVVTAAISSTELSNVTIQYWLNGDPVGIVYPLGIPAVYAATLVPSDLVWAVIQTEDGSKFNLPDTVTGGLFTGLQLTTV